MAAEPYASELFFSYRLDGLWYTCRTAEWATLSCWSGGCVAYVCSSNMVWCLGSWGRDASLAHTTACQRSERQRAVQVACRPPGAKAWGMWLGMRLAKVVMKLTCIASQKVKVKLLARKKHCGLHRQAVDVCRAVAIEARRSIHASYSPGSSSCRGVQNGTEKWLSDNLCSNHASSTRA